MTELERAREKAREAYDSAYESFMGGGNNHTEALNAAMDTLYAELEKIAEEQADITRRYWTSEDANVPKLHPGSIGAASWLKWLRRPGDG